MENKNKNIEGALKWVIVTILCFVIVLIIFITGIFVGQERARFSFVWAENYHRNFGGPMRAFDDLGDAGFSSVHGIFGVVIKIDGNKLMVKGQDNMEKTVVVSPDTVVVDQSTQIKFSDIKMGNNVVIIGDPDPNGWVLARLIRLFSVN